MGGCKQTLTQDAEVKQRYIQRHPSPPVSCQCPHMSDECTAVGVTLCHKCVFHVEEVRHHHSNGENKALTDFCCIFHIMIVI